MDSCLLADRRTDIKKDEKIQCTYMIDIYIYKDRSIGR